MKKLMLTFVVLSATAIGPLGSMAHAATVPCEEALKQLRDAETAATLSDADKATVTDLEGKGLERCKADDDAGADAFFSDAMKLVAR